MRLRLSLLSLIPIFALLITLGLLTPQFSPIILEVAAQPEGWVEIIEKRSPTSKSYVNLSNPAQESWSGGLATIHYETVLDSGIYDGEVDFNPRRVDNPQLDGWTVSQSGWHYALGQPGDKSTDGWVGFGGRQGEHWVKFRLARVGYLYWPTRTWDDIGGPPTYDRANLASVMSSGEYGHDNLVNVQTTATWADVWTTPGGGSLNISWRANADGLKEDIIINQVAREWLTTNRPPTTPAADTWFGFVLEVDWSDVPKIVRAGLELSPNDDFADDGEGLELRDALDRFLALLPIGNVRVPGDGSPDSLDEIEPLRKRFWLDGDGNHYVLVGVRADVLNGMQAGDLIFDPSVSIQVGASADDGYSRSTGVYSTGYTIEVGNSAGAITDAWLRFTSVLVPSEAPIVSVNLTVIGWTSDTGDNAGTGKSNLYFEAAGDPTAPSSQADHAGRTRTTNFVAWDGLDLTADVTVTSPDISVPFQEIVDRGDWSSGQAVQVLWDDDGYAYNDFSRAWSYDHDSSKAVVLNIEYSNFPPVITNKITVDTDFAEEAYSRLFTASDRDVSQTLVWTLVTNADFLSVESLNRSAYINGTAPASGTFFVNVTVGDQSTPTNGTDFVNYTLVIHPAVEFRNLIVLIMLPIILTIFVAAPVLNMPYLWMLDGILTILFGIWTFNVLDFPFYFAVGIMTFGGILLMGGIIFTFRMRGMLLTRGAS